MMLSPVRLVGRFRERIKPYPVWLRVLLAPLGLLMLLLWPMHVAFSVPFLTLRTIGLHLRNYPPCRQIAALFEVELYRDSRKRIPHPYDLLARSRLTRRLLALVLFVEWIALIGIGVSSGLLCLLGDPPAFLLSIWAVGFMVMVVAGMPAWGLSSYHGSLVDCWKKLNAPLCPCCGYNRLYSTSDRCPECGSLSAPVLPGEVPAEWKRWDHVTGNQAVFLPFVLLGTLGPLSRLVSDWLPLWILGVFLLMLTASVAALVGIAVFHVLFENR